MKLTRDDVLKIAKLARLHLTEEEIERYANELTNILSYVDILSEVNTDGIPETAQVTGLSNVTRRDEVKQELCTPKDLLDCSPLPIVDDQIRINRIM